MAASKFMKDVVEAAAAAIDMTVRETEHELVVENEHGKWYFPPTDEGASEALESIAFVATDPHDKKK
jgi:hypothetical protein